MIKKVFAEVARYFKHTDRVLILFVFFAAIFGLVMVYSATLYQNSSKTFITQIVAIVLGAAFMFFISRLDYGDLEEYWKYIAIAGALLLLLTIVIGKGRPGSANIAWIHIGGLSVQPSEFVKLAFIMTLAKHLDLVREEIDRPKNILLLCAHAAVPIVLILIQKDLGMLLVYLAVFIAMMFAANVQMRYFACAGIAVLIMSPVIWMQVFGETQRARFLALFNIDNIYYQQTVAYQQIQGRIALGSGKIFGFGLFNGPRTQSAVTSVLPERQNDFIFAVIGEELGFLGCIAAIAILVVIFVRIIQAARNSKDFIGSVICIGIFASFAIQAVANIGMVLILMPVIGLALPFFSSGGSSILSSFLAVGLVLSVYMHRKGLLFTSQGET
jgi:rod shape determining protein RodA